LLLNVCLIPQNVRLNLVSIKIKEKKDRDRKNDRMKERKKHLCKLFEEVSNNPLKLKTEEPLNEIKFFLKN